ncbi:MAG: SUMF1/EgtB/PvdO family nonheme iron enzyme [Nitrospirota bacterium]
MKQSVILLERHIVVLYFMVVLILICISISAADGQHTDEPENMVFIKGGCFQMGDLFSNLSSNEKPVHKVCVDDFYIGKCKVIRGGSWNPFLRFVQTTTGLCSVPGGRGAWMGFRMAHPVKSSTVNK